MCDVVDGLCLTHGYSVSFKVQCPDFKGYNWKVRFCSVDGCDSFAIGHVQRGGVIVAYCKKHENSV